MKYAVDAEATAYITIIVDADSRDEAVNYVSTIQNFEVSSICEKIVTDQLFIVGDPVARKANKSELLTAK